MIILNTRLGIMDFIKLIYSIAGLSKSIWKCQNFGIDSKNYLVNDETNDEGSAMEGSKGLEKSAGKPLVLN